MGRARAPIGLPDRAGRGATGSGYKAGDRDVAQAYVAGSPTQQTAPSHPASDAELQTVRGSREPRKTELLAQAGLPGARPDGREGQAEPERPPQPAGGVAPGVGEPRPVDRAEVAPDGDGDDPRIFVLVNGERFERPGLETMLVPIGRGDEERGCDPVAGAYCSCNKVCSCVPVRSSSSSCSCVGHSSCSCVGHSTCSCDSHSYGGGGGGGCRCAPVH